jgi:hypothetical protein
MAGKPPESFLEIAVQHIPKDFRDAESPKQAENYFASRLYEARQITGDTAQIGHAIQPAKFERTPS